MEDLNKIIQDSNEKKEEQEQEEEGYAYRPTDRIKTIRRWPYLTVQMKITDFTEG